MNHKLLTALLLFSVVIVATSCSSVPIASVRPNREMPQKILWAWERSEDLRFLDPHKFGVAFIAQSIFLEKDEVKPKGRRQPLKLASGTYAIAVTRIETAKGTFERPIFTDAMAEKTANLIAKTLELPDIKAVQVDFDATLSERSFYRGMMTKLRQALPPETPLTMTSLASWCTGDAWFNDFPVDEAVPMAFQMGADSDKIKDYLKRGSDWREPLCRASYGISVDELPLEGLISGRRMFYFSNEAWRVATIPN